MAVRLPSSPEEALGGLPSARTGRAVAVADTSAATRGVESLGAQVANAAVNVRAGWETLQSTRFDADWAKFQTDQALAFEQESEGVAPSTAAGFTERYVGKGSSFAKATEDFIKAAPDHLRDVARTRVAQLRGVTTGEALRVERSHQKTFAITTLDDSMQGAWLPQAQAAAALPSGSPEKAARLAEAVSAAEAMIAATPGLNAAEREARVRQARATIQTTFAASLPAAERVLLDPLTVNKTLVERIAEVESSGDATAANPNSSARGTHQFVKGTWLGLIRQHRPDIAKGKTDGQLLALRDDSALSAEMAQAYSVENAKILRGRGHEASAGNLYLAHFLGAAGAARMLDADPDALASEIDPAAAKANPNVFTEGMTAGQLAGWAAEKMGGGVVATDWARSLDAIPYETKIAIMQDGAAALVKARTAMEEADADRYDAWKLDFRNGIEKGEYGLAHWQQALDAGMFRGADATTFRRRIEELTKDQINLANASSWLSSIVRGDVEADSFDSDNRKRVDILFDKGGPGGVALLSDDPQEAGEAVGLLRRVAETTGILPSSAVSSLRTGIRSADPAKMMRSFEILDGLYNDDETRASVAQFFGADLERLLEYRSAVQMFPPDQVAEQLAGVTQEQRDIRQERMAVARREVADVTAADVVEKFGGQPWVLDLVLPGQGRPLPPAMPDDQIRLTKDFRETFARVSAWGLNPDEAEAKTIELMSQRWGASRAGSSVRMMRYPPESQYPAIDGGHEYLGEQLDAYMRERVPEMFSTPKASIYYREPDYWLVSTPETEAAVAVGRKGQEYVAPRYGVAYRDADGLTHVLTEPDGARPVRISFDHEGVRAASRAAHAERRAQQDLERAMMQQAREAQAALLTPEVDGTGMGPFTPEPEADEGPAYTTGGGF